jgi:hypothetical protein
VVDTTYLEGIVAQITQLIKNRFGSPYVRLCLIDPKLNELVEYQVNGQTATPVSSIANQVKTERQAVIVDTVTSTKQMTLLLDTNIQSAMAIPLTLNSQMIGVLEVQSPIAHAFGPEAVSRLTDLTKDVIEPLHNAWLLESGWLAGQTRDALRHLWDDIHLGRCPLAEWAFPGLDVAPEGGPAARGVRLRQLLLDTIDKLNPAQTPTGPRNTDRRYDILHLTYVESFTVDEVLKKLVISRRQYFYDLKDAIGAVAHLLVRTHQIEP